MTLRTAALPLLLVAAAACGSEGRPSGAPSTTPPAAEVSAEAGVEAGGATVAATAAATVETAYFTSPSGRIGCALSARAATCEVRGHRWTMPSKPAGCDLDWGGMVEVGESGGAAHACHSDTVFGAGTLPVLAYGAVRAAGPFRCTSRVSGMTCLNGVTERGFTVSRDAVRFF
jgi:hypothetical protein